MAAQRKTKAAEVTPGDFGERMKQAREAADLSLMNAAFAIRGILPEPMWVSIDPIRRMEVGITTEAKANPILVRALALVYGTTVEALSPTVAENLSKVQDLVSPDMDLSMSRCTASGWAQQQTLDEALIALLADSDEHDLAA